MRSRTTLPLLVFLMLSVGILGSLVRAQTRSPAPTVADSPNLLANPGFEAGFTERKDPYYPERGSAGELGVAEGWELWYDREQECPIQARIQALMPYYVSASCGEESYNRRPEYKGEEAAFRVRSGARSQKFFTTYGTHTAGMWQRVQVPAGSWVSFSIWAMTWSSNLDDPLYSMEPGYYAVSVGIDPTGGDDWDSKTIRWSKPLTMHDRWVQHQVSAYTATGDVTVWTRGTQVWPVKHNDSYWDDASLVVLSASPTATPVDTPTPAPMPTPKETPAAVPAGSWPKWGQVWRLSSTNVAATWGVDPARGAVALEGDALWLRNVEDSGAFALAWVQGFWPAEGDVRLSFRFKHENLTGYGTGIGVGSRLYEGAREMQGTPPNPYLNDILHVHRYAGGADAFAIRLLGRTVWTGDPADTAWHTVTLEVRGTTYIVLLDGREVGRGVSFYRPRSLYVGNPVAIGTPGRWTEVGIAGVLLERSFDDLRLPIVQKRWAAPLQTLPPPAVREGDGS